ncbi:MAG TPA: hypothetical protein VEH30_06340 [Terriglobales bacterium]|nr:hypothetical protein [Terriglobales bacterium]
MKSARIAAFAVLSWFLLASAVAQMKQPLAAKLMVDVPFDFMVDQAMFPAGSYVVTQAGDQSFHLKAQGGLESVTFATQSILTQSYAPRLIFAEENGHLQLRQLWMNSKIGGEVPTPAMQQLRAVRASHVQVDATCINCE